MRFLRLAAQWAGFLTAADAAGEGRGLGRPLPAMAGHDLAGPPASQGFTLRRAQPSQSRRPMRPSPAGERQQISRGGLGDETEGNMSVATSPISDHELCRYFCPERRALIIVYDDGRIYAQHYASRTVLLHVAPSDRELSDWLAVWQTARATGPVWARFVDGLPSPIDVARWQRHGQACTPSGFIVPIGGIGPDGAPDWLTALALP